MEDQMKFATFEISDEKGSGIFEDTQIENETEEDIQNLDSLSFSNMAISGTDWTVETIINQMKKGNIQLDPSFQRRDAWTAKVKSKFVESLFLGLPIPQIILAEQKDKRGKFIVIDGKQRLLSLKQFVLPDEGEKPLKLTGLDVIPKFNQMTYEKISNGMYFEELDAFNNQPIRTVVIKNWGNVETLYLLFLRLNTGSVKLSPQELRQALYPGKFVEFVNKASYENSYLHQMLGIKNPDFRMRDVEILTRFFAFHFYADEYKGSMQSFLDMTCEKLNKSFAEKENEIIAALSAFNSAVSITIQIFSNDHAFRKYKGGKYEPKYNRAVIDIMLYYFSQLEDSLFTLKRGKNICNQFEELCTSDRSFIAALESTTKSLSATHYRFRKWGEILAKITSEPFCIPKGY